MNKKKWIKWQQTSQQALEEEEEEVFGNFRHNSRNGAASIYGLNIISLDERLAAAPTAAIHCHLSIALEMSARERERAGGEGGGGRERESNR